MKHAVKGQGRGWLSFLGFTRQSLRKAPMTLVSWSLRCKVTITQNFAVFHSCLCFSIHSFLCHNHFFCLIKSENINVERIKGKFKFIYYIFLNHSWVSWQRASTLCMSTFRDGKLNMFQGGLVHCFNNPIIQKFL